MVYEFAGYRLDPQRRVLSRSDGKPVPLKPKVFDTLVYFVEHAGELLEKKRLLAEIWPNLIVEENNLNKNISVLRRALGETPSQHRFIVTEPNRGYRFVAQVEILEEPSEASQRHAPAGGLEPARGVRLVRFLAAAAVLGAAAWGATSLLPESTEPTASAILFQIQAPYSSNNLLNVALSPDGRRIAYVGPSELGPAVWVRPLSSLEPRVLPATANAPASSYPFWSPDGSHIAFRIGPELRKVDVDTGRSALITSGLGLFRRGTWGPDGTILFARNVIVAVSASGGDPREVTRLDPSLEEIAHSAPRFLPDGRHFLYKSTMADRRNGAIYIGSLDPDEERKRLIEAARAIYVEPGFILFTREQRLYARPFDAERLQFSGHAVTIAEDVFYDEILDTSAFDASDNRTLILRRAQSRRQTLPLVWTERAAGVGTPVGLSVESGDFRLSADGTRLAYTVGEPGDVWVADLVRGARVRITSHPDVDRGPVWSPDGTFVAFVSHRHNSRAIYRKRADGAGAEQKLYEAGAHNIRITHWSADGRYLIFERDSCIGCGYDLWVLPLEQDEAPFPYVSSRFDERSGTLSPDGRWMAYATSESGFYQIVVQPFPDSSLGKWQISADGGIVPRWARGGAELYYYESAGSIVRVPISAGSDLEVGEGSRVAETSGPYDWDVAGDGERVLGVHLEDASEGRSNGGTYPITVIVNWPAMLND